MPAKKTQQTNSNMKWLGLGVFLTIFVVITACFLYLPILRKSEEAKLAKNSLEADENKTAEQTAEQKNSDNVWQLELPNEEIKLQSQLQDSSYIYAVKDDLYVDVFKRSMPEGLDTELFSYEESVKAEKTGNLWTGLLPSIELSPDKEKLAFIDSEGLKIYSLKDKKQITIFSKINDDAEKSDLEKPSEWSIKDISDVYFMARPKWSYDGSFISFSQALYEGASYGAINLPTNEYFVLQGASNERIGYVSLVWAPSAISALEPSASGYKDPGLYVSLPNDISKVKNIAENFNKKDNDFLAASFAPGSKMVAFIYKEKDLPKDNVLAVSDIAGENFKILDSIGQKSLPFFSADENSVYFIKEKDGANILFSYDLGTDKVSEAIILPKEYNDFSDAKFLGSDLLQITFVNRSNYLSEAGEKARLVLLDLNAKKIIYASPSFGGFTKFAGFVEE